LNYHAIKHEYEPRISVSKGEYIVPDFYLPEFDCYLEYWGLDGDTDYEKRKQNKIQAYQTLKLRLVSVYQEDLDNLDSLLKEITLNHCPKDCWCRKSSCIALSLWSAMIKDVMIIRQPTSFIHSITRVAEHKGHAQAAFIVGGLADE
jgi:predicted nuclease of restriction endonuclease-like RecB superfamily